MARDALRGKWRVVLPIMLVVQALAYDLGLNVIYQMFFSEPRTLFVAEGLAYRIFVPVGAGVFVLMLTLVPRLIMLVVGIGEYRVADALLRGEEPSVQQLFPMRLLWKVFLMELVRSLLVGLQLMLLILPGIIAGYRYSMADYLLAENPELGPIEALRESRMRMMGNKSALFFLHVSYIGWMLLNVLALQVLDLAQTGLVSALLGTAMACLIDAPLSAYVLLGETAFFRSVLHRSRRTETPPEYVETSPAEGEAAPEEDREQVYAAQNRDEAAAKEMFFRHGCSRSRLREAGLMEEYEKLRVTPSTEMAWARDYGDALIRRFDREPEALDELLALSAEYASSELIDRTLQRIDRHIRQQTLPDHEILDMAGRALAMLTSGAFDGSGGFVSRKRAQVSEMADRLEQRLAQAQPDGDWRRALELVRSMCTEV